MNFKTKLNIFLMLIMSLSFVSCARNIQEKPQPDGIPLKTVSQTTYYNLDVPAWLLFPPEMETAIGIALDSEKKKPLPAEIAKIQAAESISRNNGTFLVDYSDVKAYLEQSAANTQPVDLKIELNYNQDYSIKTANELKPLAETGLNGYKLFLFGTELPKLNNDIIQVSASKIPDWCKKQTAYEDGDYIYAVGTAAETDLISAWNNAHTNALTQLAKFRLLNAVSSNEIKADEEKMKQAIDDTNKDFKAVFTKTWLYHKQVNSVPSYNVFIMLKAPQQQ